MPFAVGYCGDDDLLFVADRLNKVLSDVDACICSSTKVVIGTVNTSSTSDGFPDHTLVIGTLLQCRLML